MGGPDGQPKDPNFVNLKIIQDLNDNFKSKEKLEVLKEWLEAIERTRKYGFMDVAKRFLVISQIEYKY